MSWPWPSEHARRAAASPAPTRSLAPVMRFGGVGDLAAGDPQANSSRVPPAAQAPMPGRPSAAVAGPEPCPSPAPLAWSFNPWRERPLAAATAALLALGLCLLVATLGEPPLVRIVLALAVVGALSPALSPARCQVDEQGVEKRGPLGTARRPWSALRRAAAGPAGVLVSPYSRPHWLDPYRGLLLPLPAHADADLLADLRRRLADHGL